MEIFNQNLYHLSSEEDEQVDRLEVLSATRTTRKRIIRPRINFNFSVQSFKERFRVSPTVADCVHNIIGPLIAHKTMKNFALDPRQQLLVALHFFGSGC